MNNKGFAITTVIYGLSIMGILLMAILMGTLSSNRSNNNQFARSVEEELTRFNKTDTSFKPKVSGNNPVAQKFVVPEGESGWYRIELWGAQGKTITGSHEKEEEKVKNAYGAYTSGIIELKEGDELFFFVGRNRGDNNNGAATEVRIKDGDYTDVISYNTRIMVAAGGGSGDYAAGGTLYGYNKCMNSINGYIDTNTMDKTYRLLLPTDAPNKTNGTLVGYPKGYISPTAGTQCGGITPQGQTGTTSSLGTSGGGDGYYPGNNNSNGGVSYISGYAGSKAKIKNAIQETPTYKYYKLKYNEGNDEYYYEDSPNPPTYYFVDGMMYPGVNSGNGKAKIQRIVEKTAETQTLPRQNKKLDNVQYIKDCLGNNQPGAGADKKQWWSKLIVMHKGEAIINTYPNTNPTYEPAATRWCKTINLTATYDLDEIAVWHKDGFDFNDHTIEVSSDGTNYTIIKGKATIENGLILQNFPSETESVTGIRISAYQIDSTMELPEAGNYYIVPVLAENKVLTAPANAADSKNSIVLDRINGQKRQIWSIEKITNPNINPTNGPEYKIVELSRYKALAITHDENMMENTVSAQEKFNNNARNEPQIWKIRPMGNGTYTISTVMPVYDTDNPSGYLVPQTNADASDEYNQIVIGKDYNSSPPITTERFKLIALEYN